MNRRGETEKHQRKKIVSVLERVNSYGCHNSISKPWGYEEMKNPDEKVDIAAFRDAKKLYLGGGVTHLYIHE